MKMYTMPSVPPASKIIEANSKETRYITYIYGLDAQLIGGEKHLEHRLRAVPDAWRQYRIAMSAVDKVVRALRVTLPDKVFVHLEQLADRGEIVIRPKPIGKQMDDVQIIGTDDLKLLINAAVGAECGMCMKDAKEQRKCKLRKTLMCVCPPVKLDRESSLCPYVDVATGSETGKYI